MWVRRIPQSCWGRHKQAGSPQGHPGTPVGAAQQLHAARPGSILSQRTLVSRETPMKTSQRTGRSGKCPQINVYLWERTEKNRKLLTTVTNTQKLPTRKSSAHASPTSNQRFWNSQNKTQDHSFLFIHKLFSMRRGHLGKGRITFSFFFFFKKKLKHSKSREGGQGCKEERTFWFHMKNTQVAWTQQWKKPWF